MRSKNPEPVVFPAEGLYGRALRQIPYPHSLVFTARDDELVLRVEHRSGDVVEVPSTRVDFPSLRLAHSPDLDLPVIRSRHDQRQRGVERGEIDTAVVSFQNIFDRREIVESVERARRAVRRVLAKARNVPDANSLILRGRHDEVFLRMKLGRHDIVRVTSKNGDAVARRAVPYADRLVVRTRQLEVKYRELQSAVPKDDN